MLDVECKRRQVCVTERMTHVRTRIAPSPTGEDIHIGNLYTALLNFAVANQSNGEFLVRIEDTDRERLVEGSETRILQTLKDYHLMYNEGPDKAGQFGPYRQSDRLAIYKEKVDELIKNNHAYYCFCTKERLSELRLKQQENKQTPRYDKYCLTNNSDAKKRIESGEKYVVRLNVPKGKQITFTDLIRGEISFNSSEVDDQVLLKSDGFPTYHLAVVVDDYLMKITHVIRAEDWISSTPKHVLLYQAFGWDLPQFAHVPLLRNTDKSKLSKRKNPVWARWYLLEGYLPEAVLNYLALMGWSHPEEKEYFSLPEFVELFKITDVKPVGPIFDQKKLTWMNQQYIQDLSDSELFMRLKVFMESDFVIDDNLLEKLIPLLKTRMRVLKDVYELVDHFISEPNITPRSETETQIVQTLIIGFSEISEWNEENVFSACRAVMEQYNIRMPVLYYLLTGQERGLPLPESLVLLGKETVIKRLRSL